MNTLSELRSISTAIQEGHLQALDHLAAERATTRAYLIREAVRIYLRDHGIRGAGEPPRVAEAPTHYVTLETPEDTP